MNNQAQPTSEYQETNLDVGAVQEIAYIEKGLSVVDDFDNTIEIQGEKINIIFKKNENGYFFSIGTNIENITHTFNIGDGTILQRTNNQEIDKIPKIVDFRNALHLLVKLHLKVQLSETEAKLKEEGLDDNSGFSLLEQGTYINQDEYFTIIQDFEVHLNKIGQKSETTKQVDEIMYSQEYILILREIVSRFNKIMN